MLRLTVRPNLAGALGMLLSLPEAARFAVAHALTLTARDGQAAVRRELPGRFTIRNRWVEQGIRMERATPASLEAKVYSRDDFMARQETGGVKAARDGGRLAIPLGARRTAAGIIPRGERPRALRGNRRVFVTRGRGGTWIIAMRSGRKRLPIRVLYVLRPHATLSPRFGFAETVGRVVASRFDVNMTAALIRRFGRRR